MYGTTITGGAGSTAFTSSGLQNSETIGTVTIAYGTGASADAATGVYVGQVVASDATGGTFTASNYHITYVAANISVQDVYYRTNATGSWNWSDTTKWQISTDPTDPSSWSAAGIAPRADNSLGIEIRSGANVSVNSSFAIDQTTIVSGGTITITTGGTLAIDNGTSIDLTVTGAIVESGTGVLAPSAGSTVLYKGSDQTIVAADYSELQLSGVGTTKTFADGTTSVAQNISIYQAMTLTGSSSSAVTVQVTTPGAGGTASRVFYLDSPDATISNMTIKGGDMSVSLESGGGIYIPSFGTAALDNVVVSGSKAFCGGGIMNEGMATITNSTISGNTANFGGGIFSSDTVTITNSTINGNTADSGGGIYSYGYFDICNSTIAGNSAGYGAGVYNDSLCYLAFFTNSTVSGNTASVYGGGLFNSLDGYLLNSIIVNNTAPEGKDIYTLGGSTTYAYYSWYNGVGGDGAISTQATAQNVTTAYASGDLGALANNGGPTFTMALNNNAPAVSHGTFVYYNGSDGYYFVGSNGVSHQLIDWNTNPTVNPSDKITTDQRGVARNDEFTSMGAYTVNTHTSSVFIDPSTAQRIAPNTNLQFSAEAYDQYNNFITNTTTSFIWANTNSNGLFNKSTAGTYGVNAILGAATSANTYVTIMGSNGNNAAMNDATVLSTVLDNTASPINSSSYPNANFGANPWDKMMSARRTEGLSSSYQGLRQGPGVLNPDTLHPVFQVNGGHDVSDVLEYNGAEVESDDDNAQGSSSEPETAMIFEASDDYLSMIANITDGNGDYSIRVEKHHLFKTTTDLYLDAILAG